MQFSFWPSGNQRDFLFHSILGTLIILVLVRAEEFYLQYWWICSWDQITTGYCPSLLKPTLWYRCSFTKYRNSALVSLPRHQAVSSTVPVHLTMEVVCAIFLNLNLILGPADEKDVPSLSLHSEAHEIFCLFLSYPFCHYECKLP